jgi:ClpP class serine protease
MPDWNDILNEIKEYGSIYDIARRRYINNLSDHTGRNTILYYSGWLQKPNLLGVGIDDNDKIGFMSTIRGMDRSKGLDLILHTPGGGCCHRIFS